MPYVKPGYWVPGYAVGDITPIEGAGVASATGAGDVTSTVDLAGDAAAVADAAGGIALDSDLGGAAIANAEAAGNIASTVDLAGDAAAVADAAGNITSTVDLAGDAAAVADAAGGIAQAVDLSGTATAGATASGTMIVATADSHKLTPTAPIDLYSVDLNSIGVGEVYYFYSGTDTNSHPIIYQGNTYAPWHIKVTGLEKRGTGSSPRPVAEIGNLAHFVTDLCQQYQGLVGATVRRRRTLASYLKANIAEYRDEYYLIERPAEETDEMVKFELSSPLDFLDKQLPGLLALASGCPHRYKSTLGGSGCSWTGTNPAKWFDRFGTPVVDAGLDVCGKRLSDCKLRFGATESLDYGGNPGLGRSSV